MDPAGSRETVSRAAPPGDEISMLSASQFGPLLASAASGPEIDINPAFVAVQFVLFALLLVVMKPLLFDPLLKVFEAREARTDGARADAREMQEQAGELLVRYRDELAKVNRVASEEREKLRADAARTEAKVLAEAREVSNKIVEEGRARIAAEMLTLRSDFAARSPALARDVASAVLGREVK